MISYFQNRHLGQTCIIIGNGPSLVEIPRPFIDSYPTYGQNKCYLNQPPLVDFIPMYYITSDPDGDIDHKIVNEMPCEKFTKRGLHFKDTHEFILTAKHIFSKHPEIELYEGYSVTYISLQLAYYMGFNTVLLIGVDHRYKEYNPAIEDDPNHYTKEYKGKTDFDPRALSKGQIFINESMTLANDAYKRDGRRIVNLTPDSNMKVFEMDKVENWM